MGIRNSRNGLAGLFVLACGVFLGASMPGAAASSMIPDDGVLDYTVLRDGDPIGTHVIRFSRSGDELGVRIETDIKVKLAFITLYSFQHQCRETWRDGRLVKLTSTTDDDGTAHELIADEVDNGLRVIGDGKESRVDAGIIPASLWHADIVRNGDSEVLNTLDGHPMAIKVAQVGEEKVAGKNGPVSAKHFVVTGELERELWYDPDWVLVKVRFKGSDDSDIQYVLK